MVTVCLLGCRCSVCLANRICVNVVLRLACVFAADDDYFDNFDDGEGNGDGDGFFRAVLAQLYDEASINAVMQEWFRTVADLPLIIRQAVAMGMFSSAQLVRFLSMDVRPSVTRAVTRAMPPQVELVPFLTTPTALARKPTASLSCMCASAHRGLHLGVPRDVGAVRKL